MNTTHRSKNGFPLVHCSRCDGSGHYSWNAVHGSTCYGCSGTGFRLPKAAVPAWESYRAAVNAQVRRLAADLRPGEEISGFKGLSDRSDGNWRTVASVSVNYTEVMGTTGVDRTPSAWRCIITYTDGTYTKCSTCNLFRGRVTVDPAPYAAQAIAAVGA